MRKKTQINAKLCNRFIRISVNHALCSKKDRTSWRAMSGIMSNSLILIGAAGDLPVHLIYGQEGGDHRPFILITVTLEYVAHKTSKYPIGREEFAHFVHNNSEHLMKMALSCRNRGKTGAVLTAILPKEPHNLIYTRAVGWHPSDSDIAA
jgi:hypothetical protein